MVGRHLCGYASPLTHEKIQLLSSWALLDQVQFDQTSKFKNICTNSLKPEIVLMYKRQPEEALIEQLKSHSKFVKEEPSNIDPQEIHYIFSVDDRFNGEWKSSTKIRRKNGDFTKRSVV